MKIILGSKSQYRSAVLREAGYDFVTMNPNIDERAIRSTNFELLPILIAKAKAMELLPKIHGNKILITSDQVVVCNGELREKPTSENHARRYLKSYSYYPAQINTAVVVTNTQTGKSADGVDICKVYFKTIPDEVITKIIKKGEIFNTAGSFLTEDKLFKPYIDHFEGSLDSIRGLPMVLTKKLITIVSK